MMKKIWLMVPLAIFGAMAVGCGEQKAEGQAVGEKIRSMPPEQQLKLILEDPGTGDVQKIMAINGIAGASEAQKKWEVALFEELRVSSISALI